MSFTITLKPSNRVFAADADEPILGAAIRQGIGMPYGCRDGACGSCKCRLLEGRVEHGPHQAKALSAEEAAAGWMLSCCASALEDCTIEARTVVGAGDFPVLKMPTRVLSVSRPAPDVAVLRLQLPSNQNFRFRAGQYVQFILDGGLRRSYSIANAPHQLGEPAGIELHLRHMPGGRFTDHVFGALKPRDILRLEGPFGSFFLRDDGDKPIVLLASGTGYAPIKAIVGELMRLVAEGRAARPAVLYWGCRRRADLYEHEACEALAAATPWLRYVPVLSEPAEGDAWSGRTGFVHQAVMADRPDLSGGQVYACGAPVMVDAAQRDFVQRCGLPADEFYADAFTSEADKLGG